MFCKTDPRVIPQGPGGFGRLGQGAAPPDEWFDPMPHLALGAGGLTPAQLRAVDLSPLRPAPGLLARVLRRLSSRP